MEHPCEYVPYVTLAVLMSSIPIGYNFELGRQATAVHLQRRCQCFQSLRDGGNGTSDLGATLCQQVKYHSAPTVPDQVNHQFISPMLLSPDIGLLSNVIIMQSAPDGYVNRAITHTKSVLMMILYNLPMHMTMLTNFPRSRGCV